MATWLTHKVKVDRAVPEEPMIRLAEELQVIDDAGDTVVGVRQDASDGAWVIYYTTP